MWTTMQLIGCVLLKFVKTFCRTDVTTVWISLDSCSVPAWLIPRSWQGVQWHSEPTQSLSTKCRNGRSSVDHRSICPFPLASPPLDWCLKTSVDHRSIKKLPSPRRELNIINEPQRCVLGKNQDPFQGPFIFSHSRARRFALAVGILVAVRDVLASAMLWRKGESSLVRKARLLYLFYPTLLPTSGPWVIFASMDMLQRFFSRSDMI